MIHINNNNTHSSRCETNNHISISCFLNSRLVCNKANTVSQYILLNSFHISCITETWLRSDLSCNSVIRQLVPEGYSICYKNREEKRGGGVAVIFKKMLSYKCINLPDFKTFEVLGLTFSGFRGRLSVFTVYRPPNIDGSQNWDEFCEEMSDLLEIVVQRDEKGIY